MKPLLMAVILVIIAAIVVSIIYRGDENRDQPLFVSGPSESRSWTWENPYTFKRVLVPSTWKQVTNPNLTDTVLTLQHESSKSLVYILYEEPVEYMTLSEYMDVIKPMNKTEFGIEEFDTAKDKNGLQYYYAESARYLGNNLVGIKVRIWNDGLNSFWETVQMTDIEYKSIEYDANELVEKLIETTH